MITALFVLTLASILGSEYLKEGYFFDWRDIVVPRFTHENSLLIVIVVAIIVLVLKKRHAKLS